MKKAQVKKSPAVKPPKASKARKKSDVPIVQAFEIKKTLLGFGTYNAWYKCPHCKAELHSDESELQGRDRCPECNRTFRVSKDAIAEIISRQKAIVPFDISPVYEPPPAPVRPSAPPVRQEPLPDPDAALRCPKCHSNQLTTNKKGFGLGKAAVGGLPLGPVGLLGGLIGSGKVKITCLRCGEVFAPGQGN